MKRGRGSARSAKKEDGQKERKPGKRLRQAVGIGLWSVALTLVLYLLAYYFLPPPPPSAAVVSLLAFVSVLAGYWLLGSVRRSRADGE